MKRGRLWLVTRFLPVHGPGGLERVVQEIAFGLAGRGWRIDLVTPGLPAPIDLPAGVDLHALDASPSLFSNQFPRALLRWGTQRREKPDLLFTPTLAASPLVNRRRDIPSLFQAHGSSWAEARAKLSGGDPRGLFRLWLYLSAERRTLRFYDRIVTVGPAVRDYFASRPYRFLDPRRTVMVPNGIDPALFDDSGERRERVRKELGVGPGERIVLTAGRLVRGKGALDLLRAYARMEDRQRVRILIAGSGRDKHALHDFAAKHRLEGVRLLGAIPREQVIGLAHAADLVAQVSSGTEGLPLIVLEALYAGCPVLISERMQIPPFGGERAVFRARPADPESIARALQRGLDLRAPLTDVGRAARERFSLEQTLDDYERVFSEIIPAGPNR